MRPALVYEPQVSNGRASTGICLNMIVKDETAVLERLFRSVAPVIDRFLIVDTGSTDGTPEFILQLAERHGIPGEVHFRDWVNFGHNRQQALDLAVASGKASWLLFIDADEELGMSDPGVFQSLEPGVTYRLQKHHGGLRYSLPNLVDVRQTRWAWRSPVHEYIQRLEGPRKEITLEQAWIVFHTGEGARSRGLTQQEKFLRDAALLETALLEDPSNARNRFYLAQSYRDAGDAAKALHHYALRVDMGGWAEEVYVAQCERARLGILLGHAEIEVLAQHMRAWRLRPSRAEALWQLATYYRQRQRYAEGYLYAKVGKEIPLPADILFVRRDVYEWRLLDEFAVCAYWIGQYQESAEASERLLREGRHPPEHGPRFQKNLDFARAKLAG